MRFRSYGGPGAEFRALVAIILMGWASKAHFQATMDMAEHLFALQGRPDGAKT